MDMYVRVYTESRIIAFSARGVIRLPAFSKRTHLFRDIDARAAELPRRG